MKKTNEKKIIRQYYKRRMYKGRSAVARALDYIGFRLIAFGALYLWFYSIAPNQLLTVTLSLISVAIISIAAELYKSLKMESFIKKERTLIAEKHMQVYFTLMPREEYIKAVQSVLMEDETFIYAVQAAQELEPDAILNIYRMAAQRGAKTIKIVTTNDVGEKAASYARTLPDIDIKILSAVSVLGKGDSPFFSVTEEEIDGHILGEYILMHSRRKLLRTVPFQKIRTRRYIITALVLIAVSFITEYALYYRLLASACLSFAGISWWTGAAHAQAQNTN